MSPFNFFKRRHAWETIPKQEDLRRRECVSQLEAVIQNHRILKRRIRDLSLDPDTKKPDNARLRNTADHVKMRLDAAPHPAAVIIIAYAKARATLQAIDEHKQVRDEKRRAASILNEPEDEETGAGLHDGLDQSFNDTPNNDVLDGPVGEEKNHCEQSAQLNAVKLPDGVLAYDGTVSGERLKNVGGETENEGEWTQEQLPHNVPGQSWYGNGNDHDYVILDSLVTEDDVVKEAEAPELIGGMQEALEGDTLNDKVSEGLIPAEGAGYGWLFALGSWLYTLVRQALILRSY